MLLVLKDSTLELDDVAIKALRQKFPTKAVDKELGQMYLWLTRYEKRRPSNGWRFIDTWLRKSPNVNRPPPVTVFGWWTSDERTVNQGAALGLSPRPGETMAQFRDRIHVKLSEAA
jgi:hypothetical protein